MEVLSSFVCVYDFIDLTSREPRTHATVTVDVVLPCDMHNIHNSRFLPPTPPTVNGSSSCQLAKPLLTTWHYFILLKLIFPIGIMKILINQLQIIVFIYKFCI